jgi:hypothetical protein
MTRLLNCPEGVMVCGNADTRGEPALAVVRDSEGDCRERRELPAPALAPTDDELARDAARRGLSAAAATGLRERPVEEYTVVVVAVVAWREAGCETCGRRDEEWVEEVEDWRLVT